MDGKNGMILWVLGGAGVLFLYSAYKAKSPQTVLLDHLNGTSTVTPVPASPGAGVTPGWSNTVEPSSYSVGPGLGLSGPGVYGNTGLYMGPVPGPYAGNPNTYIPSNGGLLSA